MGDTESINNQCMKLKNYFLLFSLTVLAALCGGGAMAQHYSKLTEKVTINVTHSDADEVIRIIKRQSIYNFVYDPSELKNVTIEEMKFETTALGEVLDYLHRTKGLSFSINNKTIAVAKGARTDDQKTIEVSGKVVEAATGIPLVGATVRTAYGTRLTGGMGEFQLRMAGNGTVSVSYAGFQTKELKVTGQTDLVIGLQQANASLNEVV